MTEEKKTSGQLAYEAWREAEGLGRDGGLEGWGALTEEARAAWEQKAAETDKP